RTRNRPIDMALRRKMNHRARSMLSDEPSHQLRIADITLHEGIVRIASQRVEIRRIACISQLIQIHHRPEVLREPVQNEIRADKASPAGHKNTVSHTPLNPHQQMVLAPAYRQGPSILTLLQASSLTQGQMRLQSTDRSDSTVRRRDERMAAKAQDW